MFVAETLTGERILANEVVEKTEKAFVCPGCKGTVIFKKGIIKQPHFAHRQTTVCDSFSEGETKEHLDNKLWLQQWLSGSQLEAYLPELKQRPDILWGTVAVEVQCSALSIERLTERITNYRQHNYFSWWLLGIKLSPNKHWRELQKACSYYSDSWGIHLWTIREKEISLFYNVQLHFRLGTVYQSKTWSSKNNLGQLWAFEPDCCAEIQWQASDYQRHIQKKLFQEDPRIRSLQEQLYLLGGNIQALPRWCYEASGYYFYFEDCLLFLRYCYTLTEDFKAWLVFLKKLAYLWLFPLVSQKEILWQVYQECQRLNENTAYF